MTRRLRRGRRWLPGPILAAAERVVAVFGQRLYLRRVLVLVLVLVGGGGGVGDQGGT